MKQMTRMRAVAAGGAVLVLGASAAAAQDVDLTPADRAAIQELSVQYAERLGACLAAEYAALFAPDGYFASTFRGRVQGRQALVALVESERHCRNGTPRAGSGVPVVMIEPASGGAKGRALLANGGGAYEDEYVKTPQGWRFKSRSHVTLEELAAREGGLP